MKGPGGRGYTLIEVVVVLAVAALSAAVVVPSLGAVLDPEPRATAEAIAEAYRRARELATSRATLATVTLDLRTGSWRLFEGSTGRPSSAVAGGDVLPDRSDTRITGTGGGPAVVRFDARGRAWGPVLVVRRESRRRHVSVDVWTGTVRVR